MARHLSHMERLALPENGAPLSIDPPDQHDIEAPENGEDDEAQERGMPNIPKDLQGAVEIGIDDSLIRKWLKECGGDVEAVKGRINQYLDG